MIMHSFDYSTCQHIEHVVVVVTLLVVLLKGHSETRPRFRVFSESGIDLTTPVLQGE